MLGSKIVEYFPNHKTYVEPFMGAMNILLSKDPLTSKLEVVNDLHGELVNLFTTIKHKPEQLIKEFDWELVSREKYDHLRHTDTSIMSDVQRAHRMIYMMKLCFAGKYGDVFGTRKHQRPRLNITTIVDSIYKIHSRLDRVVIECRDYIELPRTYDSNDTLWYLDPPYLNTNISGYAEGLDIDKFLLFLSNINGNIIISHQQDDVFLSRINEVSKWKEVIVDIRQQNGAINKGDNIGKTYTECLYIRE